MTAIKAKTTFSLKDQLFNEDTVRRLAKSIESAYSGFKAKCYQNAVLAAFPQLGLKQRIEHMVSVLHEQLPDSFSKSLEILKRALPEPLDPTLTDNDFGDYIWIVPGEYVAAYGCHEKHLEKSLTFLRESTQRFSAEHAIRPFLQRFPNHTLDFLMENTNHPHYHVRRLTSEGTRPRLPWSPRVNLPSDRVFNILDKLHDDPTRYVTRSVANALNDYTKITPKPVIEHLEKWRKQEKQQPQELHWITKHALRTLIKESHPDAMRFMGLSDRPEFKLKQISLNDQVKIGGTLQFSVKFITVKAQTLNIGLRVYFRKANGGHTSKLYKIKQGKFSKNESFLLAKHIALKPMTTRALYAGTHYAAVEVNGVERAKRAFELLP